MRNKAPRLPPTGKPRHPLNRPNGRPFCRLFPIPTPLRTCAQRMARSDQQRQEVVGIALTFQRLNCTPGAALLVTGFCRCRMRTRSGISAKHQSRRARWTVCLGNSTMRSWRRAYLPRGGQIVDASLVAAPWQRNTDGEKAPIKEGKSVPEIWTTSLRGRAKRMSTVAGRSNTRRRRCVPTARSRVDIAIPVYGYKPHISINRMHGLIRCQVVTDAAQHDGARLREGLIARTARRARSGLTMPIVRPRTRTGSGLRT